MFRLAARRRVLSGSQTRQAYGNVVGRGGLNHEQRRCLSSQSEEASKRPSNRLMQVALVLSLGSVGYSLFSVWQTEKSRPNRMHGPLTLDHSSFLYHHCEVNDVGPSGLARSDASRTPSPELVIDTFWPEEARNLFAVGVLDMPRIVKHEDPLWLLESVLVAGLVNIMNPSSTGTDDATAETVGLKRAFLKADQTLYKVGETYVEHFGSRSSVLGQLPHLARGFPVIPALYFASRASALVRLYNSDTRTFNVALTGDARAVLGRPLHNPFASNPPYSAVHDPTAENTASTLSPRKISEYDTVYHAITLTADQTPSNVEEKERLEALHPGKQLFFDSADDSTQKTYLGIPTTRALGYGCLKWSLEFQRRIHEDCMGDDIPAFFKYGELPGPPGAKLDPSLNQPLPSSSSSSSNAPHDPRQPSTEHTKDEGLLKMGKTIDPTEDVWTPADIDVPELDVTLSPLTTPGSAPAAENPYLTAEPEVTTVHVKPGDFVVLGTKGLFECLSDEEIVGLIGVVEERRRHPELRQYTKSAIGTQSEKHKDRPASMKGIVAATEKIKQAHQKNAKPQVDWVRVDIQLREAMLSIGPRNPADHSSDAFKDPVSERLDAPIRRMVYRDELPVIRARSGGDILSQSIGEDDSGDIDQELLDLGFKNSRLNAAKKVAPRVPYSWWNQEPHFVMVEGDLCSVSAHLMRNAFNTKGRDLKWAQLTHKVEELKKYRDDIAVRVIFFE